MRRRSFWVGQAALCAIVAGVVLTSGLAASGTSSPSLLRQASGLGAARLAGTACPPTWSTVSSLNNGTGENSLVAVAGTSQNDVWSVGFATQPGQNQTLIEHWNGSAWSVVPSPNVGSQNNFLQGVAAVASNDAWAVGWSNARGQPKRTLIEHWNGSAWSVVSSPNQGTKDNRLFGVAAASSNDVWAGGWYDSGNGLAQILLEHWNGSTWSVSVANGPASNSFIYGVAASASNDVWAAGYTYGADFGLDPLIQHWNGSSWTQVSTPSANAGQNNLLVAITAPSSTAAWAVGYYLDATGLLRPLVERWNGSVWSVDTPVATMQGALNSVSAVSPNDVWAAGRDFDVSGLDQTLVEHWDGTAWSVASSSNVGSGQNILSGVASLPGGVLWSAGESSADTLGKTMTLRLCEQLVKDTGFSAPNATVSRGSTVAWGFPTANTVSHSVTDNSGMGLFNSGLRAPGSSFTFTFVGAGGYKVIDVATSSTTVIKVPVSAVPSNGSISTVFTITWASGNAPTGYIYDIQIKRPGSSQFVNWLTGQTGPSSTFTPDAGTGSYTFRARMHKQGTTSASNWSPTAVITVS